MQNNERLFYVGSFAGKLYVVRLDAEDGALELASALDTQPNAGHMLLSQDKTRMFVGVENENGKGGVSMYDVSVPEKPVLVNFVPSDTQGPSHVGYFEQGFLVGAGYFDGRVQAWPVEADGKLGEVCDTVQHEGGGPVLGGFGSVQDHARAHCTQPIPGTDLFLCADLGTDEVYAYRLRDGKIHELGRRKMRPGSGPRHIEIHPCKTVFYLIDEIDSEISVMTIDHETGDMQVLQRISALPDSFTGTSWGSAVHLSPDGRHLYAGNRGFDSIAVLAVSDDGTHLERKSWCTQEIRNPRDFCIDQSGENLLVSNIAADEVTLYRINKEDGSLAYTAKLAGVQKPGCIVQIQ